jgi:hypothetical protein
MHRDRTQEVGGSSPPSSIPQRPAYEGLLRLHGLIEDRSQLRHGESPKIEMLLDQQRGVIQAPFVGQTKELKLTQI